jgi:tetratricopeptide (TPR) repeat protein
MSKPCAERLYRASLAAALLAALCGCHAVGTSPQQPEAAAQAVLPDTVQHSYADALTAMRAEDWSAAQLLLQPLAEAHPELPGPAVNLGIAYARLNRTDEAQKTLEHAATSFPKFAPAQHQLGLLLSAQGHFEDADAAYRHAEEDDPAYAVAYYDRAVLNELYLQRPQQALQDYQQYQKLQADPDPQVARWITDLQRRLGLPKAAAPATEPKAAEPAAESKADAVPAGQDAPTKEAPKSAAPDADTKGAPEP